MNLWLIPQISEHCPNIIVGLLIIVVRLLIWLGMQSILMLIDGMVHEWITSVEEKISEVW